MQKSKAAAGKPAPKPTLQPIDWLAADADEASEPKLTPAERWRRAAVKASPPQQPQASAFSQVVEQAVDRDRKDKASAKATLAKAEKEAKAAERSAEKAAAREAKTAVEAAKREATAQAKAKKEAAVAEARALAEARLAEVKAEVDATAAQEETHATPRRLSMAKRMSLFGKPRAPKPNASLAVGIRAKGDAAATDDGQGTQPPGSEITAASEQAKQAEQAEQVRAASKVQAMQRGRNVRARLAEARRAAAAVCDSALPPVGSVSAAVASERPGAAPSPRAAAAAAVDGAADELEHLATLLESLVSERDQLAEQLNAEPPPGQDMDATLALAMRLVERQDDLSAQIEQVEQALTTKYDALTAAEALLQAPHDTKQQHPVDADTDSASAVRVAATAPGSMDIDIVDAASMATPGPAAAKTEDGEERPWWQVW